MAGEALLLLDASDVEEIARDLKRSHSVAGGVSVNPPVGQEAKRERKKRPSIPADDVSPAVAPAVSSSWLSLLYPVDLDSLVDEAFTPERLARVRSPATDDDDDDIDVDIDFEEVPNVERQAAQSGEIAVPELPDAAEPEPSIEVAEEQPVPDATATPPPMPPPADSTPPPMPRADSAPPPPPPQDAGGPPPVPLSVFTGESEQLEKLPDTDAAEPEAAATPPPVSDGVVEEVSEEDADETAFEGADNTSIDDVQPLSFPDEGTPPPIPLEAATPIIAPDAVPAEKGPTEEAAPPATPEEAAPPATPEEAGPPPTPAESAPPPTPDEAGPPPTPAESAPPPTPSESVPPPTPSESAPPPPTRAEAEAAPGKPPQIPTDAQGGPPAAPAAAPAPPAVPKKKRPKKFKKPWFEEFFDDDYLRTIPFMTPTYTMKEMEYLRSHMALPDGAKLLDVGCGYGRLAIEFARAGYEVTGLDTSLPLMFLAAEASTAAEVEVNFMHRDMREMSFENEFDGVYCVMTSFGYFDDETNLDVVARMHRALKPGGKLFIEVINRDFILNDLPSRVWWEGDDCVVMDEVEFNFLTSRIVSKRSVVFSDGRSVNHDLSIRAYCLHELGRMLHNSGFRVVSVTGNINTDNRFFGQHSPYLIVLSEKPK